MREMRHIITGGILYSGNQFQYNQYANKVFCFKWEQKVQENKAVREQVAKSKQYTIYCAGSAQGSGVAIAGHKLLHIYPCILDQLRIVRVLRQRFFKAFDPERA